MRVVVLSDVHGNLAALEAVLAATAAAADAVWCLGDVVGYGARPNECATLVRGRADVVLAGNHDLAAAGLVDVRRFSDDAGRSIRWTREVLRLEVEAWLSGLEPQGEAAGVGLYHGSPRDPVWEYVLDARTARASLDAAPQRVVLCGHTHLAVAATIVDGRLRGAAAPEGARIDLADGARWLLNPGSVGQPRDRDPRAAFLLLELEDGEARSAVFGRAAYDWSQSADEIREAGLPERLADRLAFGT